MFICDTKPPTHPSYLVKYIFRSYEAGNGAPVVLSARVRAQLPVGRCVRARTWRRQVAVENFMLNKIP